MALRATDRRTVLLTAGATAASALSGCSNVASSIPGNGDGNNGTDEDELRDAIEAYFDAGAAGDLDALADAVHPASPLHPDRWEGSDWEFSVEESETPDEIAIESVTADATVDDVLEIEHAKLWYEAEELEDAIGAEEIAIVGGSAEQLEADDQDVWALVTDGGAWTVLLASTEDDTPENPADALEPEIHDEDHDVVAEVDWDWDRNGTGEGVADDAEQARVVLTETPGVDADTVRIASTIAGTELEFYDEDGENASTTWAGVWGSVQLNPDGDQIVVTAVDDGEETIVHRVHYEP